MILLALGAIILVASAVQCSSMFFDEVDLYYEREEGTATAIVATSIPTPTYLTARAIEIQRELLSKSQREQYDQDIVGEAIQFRGRVHKVYPNGDITLYDDSGSLRTVRLINVPHDTLIILERDTPIAGLGIIADVGPGFLLCGHSSHG